MPVLTGERARRWIVAAGLPTSTGREFCVLNEDTNALVAAALKEHDAAMIAAVFNAIQDAIHALHMAGNVIDGLLAGHDLGTAELVYARFAAHVVGTQLEDATA
jgi:hypothetical protein